MKYDVLYIFRGEWKSHFFHAGSMSSSEHTQTQKKRDGVSDQKGLCSFLFYLRKLIWLIRSLAPSRVPSSPILSVICSYRVKKSHMRLPANTARFMDKSNRIKSIIFFILICSKTIELYLILVIQQANFKLWILLLRVLYWLQLKLQLVKYIIY